MRFPLPRPFALALLATLAGAAVAADRPQLDHNRFKWRDAQGNLHYSDVLPTDASRYGYEVVSPQGLIVKHVERARTPAEIAAAKASATRVQAERTHADALARADAQLLSGYPEESDLKRAQQQKIELLDQQVNAAQISLRSQEQTLADLLSRAADAERGDKKLPEAQARQLASMRKQVDDQRMTVVRRESERQAADEKFEIETLRYRALKAKLAEQQSQ